MSLQDQNWIKVFFGAFTKVKMPDQAFNHTDIRYYHEVIDSDFDNDLQDVMDMTDDEVMAELDALGYSESCIQKNLTICTDDHIVSFPKKRKSHIVEDKSEAESEAEKIFAENLIAVLVSDVIKGEKALPTYSTSVFNQYVNPSTTEPMDHYDPVTLENDIKKYKQKKRAQKNKFYSLAASLFLVCTLSITALTLTNEEQGIAKEKTASLVENITIDELKTSNNNISDKYLNKYYFGGTDNAVNSNINFIKLSKLYFSGHGIVESNYKFIKNTRQKLEDSKKILTQENSIVTPTLDYDHTMIFLDQLASGEVKATDEERLEILRKLLVIAKDKNLHETDVICPSSGIYEHPVSKGDTLSGIMDKCFYRVNDSRIFDIKVILNIDEVVIMSIDENRVVTNIDISRDDGIYPMYSPR